MAVLAVAFSAWQQMSEKTRKELEEKFEVRFTDYKYAKTEYVRK